MSRLLERRKPSETSRTAAAHSDCMFAKYITAEVRLNPSLGLQDLPLPRGVSLLGQ